MSIRIHKKVPQSPGFFLLSPADGSERGPLSIENLRDLAEFQHLHPGSLIRAEADANARPLSDFPDIFEIVFPKQKQFSLKPREKTDPDADLPPIDVRSLYQCLPDETPAPTAEDSAPATADP